MRTLRSARTRKRLFKPPPSRRRHPGIRHPGIRHPRIRHSSAAIKLARRRGATRQTLSERPSGPLGSACASSCCTGRGGCGGRSRRGWCGGRSRWGGGGGRRWRGSRQRPRLPFVAHLCCCSGRSGRSGRSGQCRCRCRCRRSGSCSSRCGGRGRRRCGGCRRRDAKCLAQPLELRVTKTHQHRGQCKGAHCPGSLWC